MERIKSFFRRCNCFSSSSDSKNDVNADHKHTNAKIVRSPTPSPSRESLKNNTSIVLSHGAFHTIWHYQLFCDAIQKHTNIDRIIVPQQSSSGLTPPPNSFAADIKLLHDTVANELREGRDVLLVCHSYGGIPGSEALADLPTNTPGRILGIVFVTAFVAEAGQSLVTSKLAGRASWVRVDGPLSYVNNPFPTLYNILNSTSPEVAQESVHRLVPQASTSFLTTTQHETWKSHPCVYIRCLNDQAMVVEEQNYFIARMQKFHPQAKVRDISSDHAPFASVPEKLAEIVEEVIGELRGGS